MQQGIPPRPGVAQAMQTRERPETHMQQEVRIYKSGIFGMSSAAGNFERDWKRQWQPQNWKVGLVSFAGKTISLRQVLVVTYER